MSKQPEFDFDGSSNEAPAAPPQDTVTTEMQVWTPAPSSWKEVPQARFLSWSDAEQNAYCAARDRDSADEAKDEESELFFLERSLSYGNPNG